VYGVRNGYVKFRRGILNHLRDGRMNSTEFAVYSAMILDADPATGILMSSARALAFLFNGTLTERAARRALDSLENNPEGPYIKRFTRPGSHGNYPILINRFDCTAGARMGMRLNADATTDWREPVYCNQRAGGEDAVEDGARRGVPLSADVTTSWLGLEPPSPPEEIEKARESGEEGAFIYEGTRVREKEKENTKKPAKAKVPPSFALPIFEPAKQYAYDRWQKKFGSKPSWGPKDFAQLARLLRRQRDLSLDEFSARWKRYLADPDSFVAKQGYSLSFFCSRFDAYLDRNSQVPEL
jgi:hypothetical protein